MKHEPTAAPLPVAEPTWVARFLNAAGLDFHILLTLLFRGWSVLAGGSTALLIPSFLSPSMQGYYFTFNSILATQIFFELGLNYVLTQLTSHAAAHLRRRSDGGFEGESKWQHAIASLLRLSLKWNAIMATLFLGVLLSGGSYFFARTGSLPTSQWLAPWIVLSIAAALNLAMSAMLAICEGLGEVGQVARLRLRQSIVGYGLMWALLLSGQGLLSAAALPLSSVLMTAWWLSRHPQLRWLQKKGAAALGGDTSGNYSWGRDVFPLQWKIALSWASGYFIFNFITPAVFAHQGAVEAGKLGLALSIFSSLTAIGMSWISAKTPELAGYIARNERRKLNYQFGRYAVRSVVATAVCVFGTVSALEVAGLFVPKVLYRLPDIEVLLLLCVIAIANASIFAMATYMRAHKEEPMLAPSLAAAVFMATGVYFGSKYGVFAVVAVYGASALFLSLPWCVLIFRKYARRS